jgi:hypothetical protein
LLKDSFLEGVLGCNSIHLMSDYDEKVAAARTLLADHRKLVKKMAKDVLRHGGSPDPKESGAKADYRPHLRAFAKSKQADPLLLDNSDLYEEVLATAHYLWVVNHGQFARGDYLHQRCKKKDADAAYDRRVWVRKNILETTGTITVLFECLRGIANTVLLRLAAQQEANLCFLNTQPTLLTQPTRLEMRRRSTLPTHVGQPF